MRLRPLLLGFGLTGSLLVTGVGPAGAASPYDDGLLGSQDPATYNTGAYPQSLALLGVVAGGKAAEPEAQAAAGWLIRQQCPDGGWEFYRADITAPCTSPDPAAYAGEDTNSTAVAVSALEALGAEPAHDALDFLRSAQNDDGGYGYVPGAPTDPNSTALVIQALIASDVDPGSWHSGSNLSPYDALLSFQLDCTAPAADRGAFGLSPDAPTPNALATVQAVPAAAGVAYPLPAVTLSDDSPVPDCPAAASRGGKAKRQAVLSDDPAVAARYGATWLASQITDGGYLEGAGGPDYGTTAYAVLAMAATRTNSAAAERAAAYLADHVDVAVRDDSGEDKVGTLGLLALVQAAMGSDAGALASRILDSCTGDCDAASPTPSPSASPTPSASPSPSASATPDPTRTPTVAPSGSGGPASPVPAGGTLPFTGGDPTGTLLVAGALVAAGLLLRRIGARR